MTLSAESVQPATPDRIERNRSYLYLIPKRTSTLLVIVFNDTYRYFKVRSSGYLLRSRSQDSVRGDTRHQVRIFHFVGDGADFRQKL
jgi:hypothetical protein